MSDDINRQVQSNAELLNRADTLLARRKNTANATPPIPVLTAAIGQTPPIDTAVIPTLTDIVALPSSVPPANSGASNLEPPGQTLEQTVYRKLKRHFDQEIAGMSQQPATPEIVAAFNQALRKLSGELQTDIDAMVRAAVEEALRSRTQEPREALSKINTSPDSPTPR